MNTNQHLNHYLIGCGGIGAWVAFNLIRQLPLDEILILKDGDTIEPHNLDRQLFPLKTVGMDKPTALQQTLSRYDDRHMIRTDPTYLAADSELCDPRTLFVGADNNAARRRALAFADHHECPCIIGANELIEAEAYYNLPAWKGTKRDPRVYYPDLLEDKSPDPTHPSCTGEAQESHPQLALANMQAATYMLWLWYVWENTRPEIDSDDLLPFKVRANRYGSILTEK
jgi:hypothetical protein